MTTTSTAKLRGRVRRAYSEAAKRTGDDLPISLGRESALSLGYPQDLLERLPSVAVDAFAGVSSVAVFAQKPPGSRVLDLECGAGLDSFIAAQRAGPAGWVVGVDSSEAILARPRRGAKSMGGNRIQFLHGDAENLELEDASMDIALVNGLSNLNPLRGEIFQELARVLRPGRARYAAELIVRGPLPAHVKSSEANWFA